MLSLLFILVLVVLESSSNAGLLSDGNFLFFILCATLAYTLSFLKELSHRE